MLLHPKPGGPSALPLGGPFEVGVESGAGSFTGFKVPSPLGPKFLGIRWGSSGPGVPVHPGELRLVLHSTPVPRPVHESR